MSTAVVFTGQGAQHAEMAQPWLRLPTTAALLAEASDVLGYDLADACRFESVRTNTWVAQPALFTCGVAGYWTLADHGLSPVVVAGHSVGEFAALVAAGAIEFAPALRVVAQRAAAMAEASAANPGAMTAVIGPHAAAHAAAALATARAQGNPDGVLVVANDNGPRQVVLSGTVPAVERAETLIRERGARAIRLAVAGAFHSPLMATAAARVATAVDGLSWSTPSVPVIPNLTGLPTRDPGVLADALRRHLLAPVRWHQTVRTLGRLGITRVVECGPARILGPLTHQVLSEVETLLVGSPDDASAVLDVVGQAA